MAEEKKIYIDLQVRADDAQARMAKIITQMAALKQQQRDLDADLRKATAAWKQGAITQEEYNAALAKYGTEMARLKGEMRPLQAEANKTGHELKNIGHAMEDSLDGMRAQLSLLLRDFDRMSTAEKNSAAGQDLKKHIDELTEAVSEQEQATGRFQRKVGNYQSIWEANAEQLDNFGKMLSKVFGSNSPITQAYTKVVGFGRSIRDTTQPINQAGDAMRTIASTTQQAGDAVGGATRQQIGFARASQQTATSTQQAGQATKTAATGFGGLTGGIKAATQASIRFLATPIGAIIGAIAAAVALVVAAFKKMSEAIKRSDDASTALESLKAVAQSVSQFISRLFDVLTKAITPVIEGIGKAIRAVASLIPGLNEIVAANEEAVRAADKLEDVQRAATVNAANRRKEEAKLEQIYQDSTKSAKERAEALQQVVALEQETAKERLQIAREELRIEELKLKAANDNSDAAKDRLATLRAAVTDASTAVEKAQSNATRRLSAFNKQMANEAKAAADAAREALKKQLEDLQQLRDANERKQIERINDMFLHSELLAKNDYDKQLRALEENLKKQQALVAKYAKDTKQYTAAVQTIEELNEQRVLLTETYNATIEALTKKHGEEIAAIERSNDDLRISIIKDEQEREQAQYTLTLRRLKEQQTQIADTYASAMEEVAKLQEAGTISAQRAEERRLELQIRFANESEAIMLRRTQAEQAHMKTVTENNVKEVATSLKAIQATFEESIEGLTEDATDERLKALRDKEASLAKLRDEIAGMTDEEAIRQFGSLDKWREQVTATADAWKAAGDKINATTASIEKRQKEAMSQMRDTLTTAVSSVKGLTETISGYYQQEFESITSGNEELTASQKREALKAAESQYHAAIAGIILDQAQGIGNVTLAGTKALAEAPFPLNIAAMAGVIASGLATLLSGIMSAKQATATFDEQKAKIAQMAVGGLVQGAGTTTSDSVPAMLSNGESVLTARATAAHYDTLSRWNVEGGGVAFPGAIGMMPRHFAQGGVATDYTAMTAALKDAVSEIQPVVSVREITQTQQRVAIKERLIR